MRMIIEVEGGLVQDVTIEVKTCDVLIVPEVVVKDRDVEGKEEDEIRTDADGEHLLIPMPVSINVLD